ncbi:MAG TPA: hypothetical protein VM370_01785 [Candidatus Thermoplasmatota archaeon]|nr:hypothetical protein [Candidatus Thermoplasmatota archaeon]
MKRALILAAILLLPLLPGADAAGPEPRPWSAYNAVSDVVDLAMAADAGAIAAALGASSASATSPNPAIPNPRAPAPCAQDPGLPAPPPTVGACGDLAILEFETGFARNGSFLAPNPLGRTHVAVSRDGSAIASVGIDGATPTSRSLHLRYMRITPGTNWTSGTPYERDVSLPATAVPVGLTLSDDGRRVALLAGEGTNYVLRGYAFGSTLDSAFEIRAPGTPRALATAGDMSRVLLAGQFPEGNFTYGGAFIVPFAQGEPLSSFFDRAANNTDVVSAALSRDGMTGVLGAADGRVHVFHEGTLAAPMALKVGTGPVGNLTISEDGGRAAASTGMTLANLAIADAPTIAWNATLTGQNVTGLAMNRTGGLLLAATSGTGGAVSAFDESDNAPLWSLPGDSRGVAIDSAGTRLAFAQRSTIGAARIPRALTMDLAGADKKVAPPQTIALPGSHTFEVTVRNDGAATERVVFADGAPEVTLTTSPAQVSVRPGQIARVNLTVTVDQPLPGPRVFNVSARAVTSGIVDNVTLSIVPKPTLDVKLQLNDSDVLAQPGAPAEILVTIVNNGTSDADVALRVDQTPSAAPDWGVQLSESAFQALRGTRTSVRVSVTPPPQVANGTSTLLKFTLQGTDIFDTATVTFRVNPDLKVDVNASGSTKFIEPGKRGFYNVTVTNTGSLPRAFLVFYTITETNGRSWAVDMQSETLRLEPNAKRVFPVAIIAPGDAQPTEHVSVVVSAKSIPEQANELVVQDNVTLSGVAVALKIPTPSTTPNGLPFLAPGAIVAVTLFAAVLLRRRDP